MKSPETRVRMGVIGRCGEARRTCVNIVFVLCGVFSVKHVTWFMKWLTFDSITWRFEVSFVKKRMSSQRQDCTNVFFSFAMWLSKFIFLNEMPVDAGNFFEEMSMGGVHKGCGSFQNQK